MPYARRNFKPTGYRKRTYRRKLARAPNRKIVSTIKRIVRKMAPKELKYRDLETDMVNFSAVTDNFISLCDISVGDTVNNRDGNVAYIKSMQLYMRLRFDPTLDTDSFTNDYGAPPSMYWWIISVKNSDGTAPVLADVLQDTVDYRNSFRLIDETSKVSVLKSGRFIYDNEVGKPEKIGKVFLNFKKPHMVKYKGTGASYTDIQNGGIYLLTKIATDNGAGGTAGTWLDVAQLKLRLRFMD